jgi:MFS family permease
LGSVVSLAGDWFTLITLYALLNRYTGQAESLGLVLLARMLPQALFGPLAGVAADRFPRRTVMVVCDIFRAAIVLAFLGVEDARDVWLIYGLTFLQMSATSFFDPAEQAAIASTVEANEIVTANTLQGITWSAMLSIGAVLGGITAAAAGVEAAFMIDAASYLLSALLISGANVPFVRRERHVSWQAMVGLTDLAEGIRRLMTDQPVRRAIWVKTAWAIPGGGALVLYAVFGGRFFAIGGHEETGIGILLSMRGIGAFLGPLIARRWGGDMPQFLERAISLSFALTAFFWLCFAWSPTLPVAAVALALAHTGISTQWVFSSSLINLRVEDAMRGRMIAVDLMGSTLMLGLSSWAVGAALDTFPIGPRGLMTVLSAVLLATASVWWATASAKPDGLKRFE